MHRLRAPAVGCLLCTAKVDSVNKTCSRWPGWGTRFAAGDSFLEAQRSWCGGLQLRTQSCKWWKRVPPMRRGTPFAAGVAAGNSFLEARHSCCGGLQLRTQSCKWWKRVPLARRGTRFAAGDSFRRAPRSCCGGLQLRSQSCKWWKRVPPVRRGTRFATVVAAGELVSRTPRSCCGGLQLISQEVQMVETSPFRQELNRTRTWMRTMRVRTHIVGRTRSGLAPYSAHYACP